MECSGEVESVTERERSTINGMERAGGVELLVQLLHECSTAKNGYKLLGLIQQVIQVVVKVKSSRESVPLSILFCALQIFPERSLILQSSDQERRNDEDD